MFVALTLILLQVTAMPAQKQIIGTPPASGTPFSPAVKASGLVYVAGTLATDAQGKIVSPDIKAQTKQVLDNIAAVLKAADSSLDRAASVYVYLKHASDFPAMNEVYRTYWKADLPARTTVEASLVVPDALVEISMIAIPNGAERKVIQPSDWLASPNPYSYGIQSGNTLFLSGLVSRNGKDNSVVAGDITAQTKTVLDNGGAILKAAGMSYNDVVSARVYITDTAMFQDMNAAYRTYFPKDPPARATVRAPLMGAQYLVEITMVAVQGTDRQAFVTPNADGTPGQPNPNLSSAIRIGNRLYVSGMLGNTDANKGDAKAQTTETLTRIGRTLKAAGFDWSHVVDGIVYLPDLANFAAMNQAYREVFPKDFPARATVSAGLVAPDGMVEIMYTVVK
jgi:2-iminobutanoate/2-iminopropanoate deaminase